MRALLISLLLIALPVGAADLSAMRAEPLSGDAASFSLTDLAGNSHELSEWRGKLVLINFWATWCGPCRTEMPGIERLWQRYRDQGLVILAISVDEGMERRIATFVKRLNLSLPILLDPESKVADHYQVSGLPHSVLIDQEGHLIAQIIGERQWDSPEAYQLIEQLLEP